MKKLSCIIAALFCSVVYANAQTVDIFDGSYKDAVANAATSGKIVMLNVVGFNHQSDAAINELFKSETLASYLKEKFVVVRVNNAQNPEVLKKLAGNKVYMQVPLYFINGKGKVISYNTMPTNEGSLLRLCRIAAGDKMTPDQLYSAIKKNPADYAIQQELLLDFPYFMPVLTGSDLKKWNARVKPLFSNYVANKGLENMVNVDDFRVITMFHPRMTKDDKIFEHLITNFDSYCDLMDPVSTLVPYITGLHIAYALDLARKGDMDYAVQLDRIAGDMRKVYAFMDMSPERNLLPDYQLLTQANYASYFKKDVDMYLPLMEKYLSFQDPVKSEHYVLAYKTLLHGTKKANTKLGYAKCIEWISAALKDEKMPFVTQIDTLIELGDCFAAMGDADNARKVYGQVNAVVMQTNDPAYKSHIGKLIFEKLAKLPASPVQE